MLLELLLLLSDRMLGDSFGNIVACVKFEKTDRLESYRFENEVSAV